jgi:hypothetical protein
MGVADPRDAVLAVGLGVALGTWVACRDVFFLSVCRTEDLDADGDGPGPEAGGAAPPSPTVATVWAAPVEDESMIPGAAGE